MEPVLGFLILFPAFMLAVMIHEVSHGWVALAFGDPTAKQAGRLTLNPLKHIDPVGTLLLPLMLKLLSAPFVFGWAKPVPVDPNFFKHPKRDMLWVGAAGPASNFLLAVAGALILKAFGLWMVPWAAALIKYLVLINLVLGTFNLLPVPPLDGSRILAGLLPARGSAWLNRLEPWGFILILALLWTGTVDLILWPAVAWMAQGLGL